MTDSVIEEVEEIRDLSSLKEIDEIRDNEIENEMFTHLK
jgi:hypothetical protein